MYDVHEIFHSIQGEGSWLGKPCTFIRMSHCNLNCPWCDTDFSKLNYLSVDQIINSIIYPNVVITGGEPLLQDLEPLLKAMPKNVEVAIETNGTQPIPLSTRPFIDHVVCSPKRETGYVISSGLPVDEVKFVVDEKFSVEEIPEQTLFIYAGNIWLQPESSQMREMSNKCYNIAMEEPRLRVGVQLHKIMGVE